MRLQTDVAFSVSANAPTSSTKAFKAIRKLSPQISLGDFNKGTQNNAVLANVITFRNEIGAYIDNLATLLEVLKELKNNVTNLLLTDSLSRSISLDDIEETLSFHQSYQPIDLVSELSNYLRTFQESDWLANSGQPIDADSIIAVPKPPKGDKNWTYIQIAMQNRIANFLVQEAGYHHGCLQPHYDQLMPFITHLTRRKLDSAADLFDHSNEPAGLIMLSCIEMYFSNRVPNGEAVKWAQWLTRGHVPCGWRGDYPDGLLLVW